MDRENELIERVRRRFPSSKGGLRVGIGDDAAVLGPLGGRQVRALPGRSKAGTNRPKDWVITTDAFLENVHFLRKVHPPDSVGYKALARATSDIAAMGARGRYFFLTLGLPAECAGKWLDDFLGGMARAASRFGLVVAGGDTTKYQLVVSSLTVLGEIESGKAILRSGARPGDLICVSGRLGEAELGLRLVQTGLHERQALAKLTKKHFYPEPQLALGEWLAAKGVATSMIDTSDGLSTDLGHICEGSRVGAKVWSAKIPVVRIPADLQQAVAGARVAGRTGTSRALWMNLNRLELALHGGEDYELLFTVPKKMADRLPRAVEGVPLTVIGEITRSKAILIVDEQGRDASLRPQGWDPFRKPGRR
jgi:thiamine-monophosphate kinase